MSTQYDFSNIPSELKSLAQWVLWKYELRNGKKTKVPMQYDGTPAMANYRRTWSTYPTAEKYYREYHKEFDGIGFVFSKEDEYVGIDIDKCVVDGELSEVAEEIVELLDSYTEYSVSGTGLHIIVKASLPQSFSGTGRKNSELGLEVYSYGRYFTFTGNTENDNTVQERSDELGILLEKYFKDDTSERVNLKNYTANEMYLNDDALWQKMFDSKNGSEIKSLFNGNLINNDHSASDLALCNHLAFWTGKSAPLMDRMFRQSNLIRDKWDIVHHSSGETYGERTISIAISSTSTTVLDREQNKEQYKFNVYGLEQKEKGIEKTKFRLSELGNAERMAASFGDVVRHVADVGFYIWNGKSWAYDSTKEIEKMCANELRKLYKSEEEEEQKWAKICDKRAVRTNSIKDLIPLVPAVREQFDKHKYLFNCSNGIINLENGTCLPHDRTLYLSKISNIKFDNTADCPTWIQFLNSVFKKEDGTTDTDLIRFMQKAVGYSMTGDISEQVIFFLVGGGRNGKSTFVNIIQDLMGDYGRQTNSDTFIKKKNDSSINNDIARLVGSRYVSAVESEEGQQLSETLVKQITGGEKISARFLRQEFFEFEPEFKVFFTTNHKPIVKGIDEGIWRRILMIPFNVTIPTDQIDKKLPEKLEAEMSGILNWAIEGCLMWQKEGLGRPHSMIEATKAYKSEMDILEPFLEERCNVNPLLETEAKELYYDYSRWCEEVGEFPLKNRSFYRMLETKGFKKSKGNANKTIIKGLGLIEVRGQFPKSNIFKSY